MTVEQAEPMLPDAVNGRSQTPFEVGHEHGVTGHEFYNDPIPPKHRRDYARGYTRGATERARTKAEESN